MRLLSTIKNSISGLLYQIVYVVLGLASRWIFVQILGLEYYGLSGLISSILVVFSLADLGLSQSISYNLYKPLSENDTITVSKFMNFFRKFYHIIAAGILVIGFILSFFIDNFINTSFNSNYIQIIFIIFIIENSVQYLFSYKFILLIADQKNYIYTLYEILTISLQLIVRIVVLIITKSYILYLFFGILIRILGNILISKQMNKIYPYLKEYSTLNINEDQKNKLFSDTKNIAIYKFCSTINNSISNILISIFSNILTVGLYSNYYLVLNIVNGVAGQFINSYQASLGNIYAIEGKDRLYDFLKNTTFISFAITSFIACVLYNLTNKFISIWMGIEFCITDNTIIFLFLNFCVVLLFDPLNKIINAGGLFNNDKWNVFIGTCVNIFLSYILGYLYGLIGIFIGTLIGTLISNILRINYLFKSFFKISCHEYIKKITLYFFIILMEVLLVDFLVQKLYFINYIANFIVSIILCVVVPILFSILIFKNNKELIYLMNIIKYIIYKIKNRN